MHLHGSHVGPAGDVSRASTTRTNNLGCIIIIIIIILRQSLCTCFLGRYCCFDMAPFFDYVYLILVLYIHIFVILVGIKFRRIYMFVADIARPAGHGYT